MSRHFIRELDTLKKRLLHLGAVVEDAIHLSIQSLLTRDVSLAQRVIDADDGIDELEIEIEEDCLKILALHQPVATDLRFIAVCLKINSDLERMGDQAVNIAERGLYLGSTAPIDIPPELPEMASVVKRMVKESLDSLVNRDAEGAVDVCRQDDEADALNRSIWDQARQRMHQEPDKIEVYQALCTASSNLERMADLATNIAEDVVYMVTGEIIRHQGLTTVKVINDD